MKKNIMMLVAGLFVLQFSQSQPLSGEKLRAKLRENLALAQTQYKLLHANIPADRMPQNQMVVQRVLPRHTLVPV
jgi:hypothetical protein